MREVLYIDGKKADTSGKPIALTFESNLLGDVTGIKSDHTATIKLPRTRNNDAIFKGASIPSVEASTTHTPLPARYELDGYPVISDGFAVLLATNANEYEVTIIFGVLTAFGSMANDTRKLPELAHGTSYDQYVILQEENPTSLPSGSSYGFIRYDSAPLWYHEVPRLLPTVSAEFLLNLIRSRYSVSITVQGTVANDYLSRLVFPLVTADHHYGDTLPTAKVQYNPQLTSAADVWGEHWDIIDTGQGLIKDAHPGQGTGNWFNVILTGDANVSFTMRATSAVSFSISHGGIDNAQHKVAATLNGTTNLWECEVTIESFSMNKGDAVMPTFDDVSREEGATTIRDMVVPDITLTIEAEKGTNIEQGYQIAPNLPDMTAMEFIKELCGILGLQALPNGNGIKLVSLNDIANETAQEVEIVGLSELSYRQGDTAQANVYKYATDDHIASDFRGSIDTIDTTLDAERDAFISRFAGHLPHKLPIYHSERDNGTPVWAFTDGLEPRVALLPIVSATWLSNFELDFASTLPVLYSTLSAILRKPKRISATALMKVWELKRLDITKPIYLRQTGRKYLIDTIKFSNGTATIDAVQL